MMGRTLPREDDVVDMDEQPQPTVREARIEDLAEIVDLLGEGPAGVVRDAADLAPYTAALARILASRGQVQAVAVLGGQIVGTAQLTVLASLEGRGATSARIAGVHTLSSLRGKGIGEALFAWVEQEAARRGAATLMVEARPDRVNEHRYYEHLGFTSDRVGFIKRVG